MLLNESIESCREDTDVKVVMRLNRATPSSCEGRLPNCVKMVSLMSPLMEDLMHENMALELCIALLFVRVVVAAVISASVIE